MSDGADDNGQTSRRVVLGGVGAAGLLGLTGALAACGSDDKDSTAQGATSPGPTAPSSTASSDDTGGETDDGSIAKTSDIPVGGGKIFSADNVVVTQPKSGDFKAFSATCTHKSCLVGAVRDGKIVCTCHGSEFSITDGSVVAAPRGMTTAQVQPLPEKTVTVSGDQISVG